jgi:hypothetical protein
MIEMSLSGSAVDHLETWLFETDSDAENIPQTTSHRKTGPPLQNRQDGIPIPISGKLCNGVQKKSFASAAN